MRNIERKHQLYGRVSLLGRALGHETRLELLELLSQHWTRIGKPCL